MKERLKVSVDNPPSSIKRQLAQINEFYSFVALAVSRSITYIQGESIAVRVWQERVGHASASAIYAFV
jgi:hypothetical protein